MCERETGRGVNKSNYTSGYAFDREWKGRENGGVGGMRRAKII